MDQAKKFYVQVCVTYGFQIIIGNRKRFISPALKLSLQQIYLLLVLVVQTLAPVVELCFCLLKIPAYFGRIMQGQQKELKLLASLTHYVLGQQKLVQLHCCLPYGTNTSDMQCILILPYQFTSHYFYPFHVRKTKNGPGHAVVFSSQSEKYE